MISRKLFSFSKTKLGDLIVGLSFGKFNKLLPIKRITETDKVISFWHAKAHYKKHILIVPKKPIKKLTSIEKKDMKYINDVFLVAKELVKKLDLEKEGYTLLVNGGKTQKVKQLHFHLISQEK